MATLSLARKIERGSGRRALGAITGFCLVTGILVAALVFYISSIVPVMGATSSTGEVAPVSLVQTQVMQLQVNHTALEKRVEDEEAREQREKAANEFNELTASVDRRFHEFTAALGRWWTEKRLEGLEGKSRQFRSGLVSANTKLNTLESRQNTLTSGLEQRPTETQVKSLIVASEGRQDQKLTNGLQGVTTKVTGLSAAIETRPTFEQVKKLIADAAIPQETRNEALDTRIKAVEGVNLQQATAIDQLKAEMQKLLTRFSSVTTYWPSTNVMAQPMTTFQQPACVIQADGKCLKKR